jgi:hypothetical protein
MSREQLTDQQFQEGTGTSGATKDETHGLPPALHAQVERLGPGDVRGLRDLLTLYSTFSQGILAVASHRMSMAAVKQAIALTEQNVVGRPPTTDPEAFKPGGEFALEGNDDAPLAPRGPSRPLTQEQMRPGGEFEVEGSDPQLLNPKGPSRPLTQEQMRPGGEFEVEGSDPQLLAPKGPSRPLTQEQMRPGGEFEVEGSDPQLLNPGTEPAWVAGARRYNDAQASFVADFNEATNNSCVVDGKLDPQAVARWQAQHGIGADGKVGPQTLAAARKASVSEAPKPVETEARPPV